MLANKEDKNLPKENTRLNFISSLQSPLLPALLLCRVHSDPSGRQWVDRQSRSVYRAFSFLFCAPHLCSMLQRMQFPSGMNLLWSGLIQSPHSLFGAIPAAGWAHPAPTAPLGCACLTIEQLLLSHCLFPLFFRPILDTFHRGATNSSKWLGFGHWCVYCKVYLSQSRTWIPVTEATPAATSATRTLSFTPNTDVSNHWPAADWPVKT